MILAFALGVLAGVPLGPLAAYLIYRLRRRDLPAFEVRARQMEKGVARLERKAARALASESIYQSQELAPRYLAAARDLAHRASRVRSGDYELLYP